MPLISVIIPVYDKAAHLKACLESVLSQTFRDIEVICVDDVSSDGSFEILRAYADKDPRVKVLSNPRNYGPGLSRNAGLSVACGQYVQFTDADDALTPNALMLLYLVALGDGCDVVRGQLRNVTNHNLAHGEASPTIPERRRFRLKDEPALWTPWGHCCCLMARDLIERHRLRYPSLRDGEDPVFMASVLTRAQCISVIPEVTYIRRVPAKFLRASLDCLRDLETHARVAKDILLSYHPDCWYLGYGAYLREILKLHIKNMTKPEYLSLDHTTARAMIEEIERITSDVRTAHQIFADSAIWSDQRIATSGLAYPEGRASRPDCSRFQVSFFLKEEMTPIGQVPEVLISAHTQSGVTHRHLHIWLNGIRQSDWTILTSSRAHLIPLPPGALDSDGPVTIDFEVVGLKPHDANTFDADRIGIEIDRFEVIGPQTSM